MTIKIRRIPLPWFARAACAVLVLSTVVWAQGNSQTLLFSAGAYGTYAFVGKTVISGKTAPVGVGAGSGCGTPQVGASQTGTVLAVNDPPLITTGVINTSASSSASAATASSDVHQVNLLAGLITTDEVKAVSTTSDNGGTLSSSADGSNFVNLVVAGNSIQGTPPPNTTIDLPSFGRVVLNEQIPHSRTNNAGLTVNMIHMYITMQNPLGIPVNTQVIVAHATSGLTLVSGPAVVDGRAFGTEVYGSILRSSPTAPVSVPCEGTDGKVLTNSVAGVNLNPLVVSGTVTDTAEGEVNDSSAQSQTTSAVQAVNLLEGGVTADVIHAEATAFTRNGKTFFFSDNGSSFANLKVAGHPEIKDDVPPNTKVDLAGFGTLWLHRVIKAQDYIEVRMIELDVSLQNNLGIPVGTHLRVADASASLHSNSKP